MEYIANDLFKITVNNIGGSLTSILDLKNNRELIHQIDDGGWKFQDVMIFPIIGQYEYSVNDKTYNIPSRHGFIREKEFEFRKLNSTTLIATYVSSKIDLDYYPYKFIYEIKYELIYNKYRVTFKIINLSDINMFFSLGNHLGIKIDNSSYIDLNNNITYLPIINGNILLSEKILNFDKISLNNNVFDELDTIILLNKTKKITLHTDFYNFDYDLNSPLVALWQNPKTNNFICVEPWWGIASYNNEPKTLNNRLYINKLSPNESAIYSFSITINKIN